MVGVTGFEPVTPGSRSRCATKLRYTPNKKFRLDFNPSGISRNRYSERANKEGTEAILMGIIYDVAHNDRYNAF